jgi:glutathione S-transferase
LKTAPVGGLHPEIDLPYTQEWELYHNSFSLCSKKLRVCMAELGLPYRSHHVHLIETGCYQNVGRRHLAVNPAGTVPVMVHRGHPVYESHDEIVYAAEQAGPRGRELLPGDDDPETRAIVDRWVDCASIKGNPIEGLGRRAGNCVPGLTLPIFATMVRYIPYTEILKGLLRHPNKERPLIFATLKRFTVRGLPKLPPVMKLLRNSRRHMQGHLDALEEQLEKRGGAWITGDRFTLADVSWVVILDRLVEADWGEYFWGDGKRPAVAAYWQALQARPSYRTEILEARCPITLQGIEDVKQAKASDPALRQALEGAWTGGARNPG